MSTFRSTAGTSELLVVSGIFFLFMHGFDAAITHHIAKKSIYPGK